MIAERIKEIEESLEMLATVFADLRLQLEAVKAEFLPKEPDTGCENCDRVQRQTGDTTQLCPHHRREFEKGIDDGN